MENQSFYKICKVTEQADFFSAFIIQSKQKKCKFCIKTKLFQLYVLYFVQLHNGTFFRNIADKKLRDEKSRCVYIRFNIVKII